MRVFLDDLRVPSDIFGDGANEEWVLVSTIDMVKDLLLQGCVSHLSLDNDLGLNVEEGYKVVYWMIENNVWPTEEIIVHSSNVIRSHQMREDINRYFYNGKKKEKENG